MFRLLDIPLVFSPLFIMLMLTRAQMRSSGVQELRARQVGGASLRVRRELFPVRHIGPNGQSTANKPATTLLSACWYVVTVDRRRCEEKLTLATGHSMTIIGTEKLFSGETQLLVFDPSFKDSSEVRELVGHELEVRTPDRILRQYRRGSYLRKFKEFEVLRQVPLVHFVSNSLLRCHAD